MSRKPKDYGHKANDIIATRSAQGWTSDSIVKELEANGITMSRRTVDDRRGRAAPTRAPKAKPRVVAAPQVSEAPLPEDPEDVPEGASVDQYDYWIGVAQKNAKIAQAEKNLPGVANMVGMANRLLEAKRKATPPPVPDPNLHPDMIKLGEETKARIHKMIDLVCA